MATKQIAEAYLRRLISYGPAALRGKGNVGYCEICHGRTLFVLNGPSLRDDYRCVRCESIPRWRALLHVLNTEFPDWRRSDIHEPGGGGAGTNRIRADAPGYSASQFHPQLPLGAECGRVTNQDLEALTFSDDSFDLFITQDVLEHVLRPDRAFAEIRRVLRSGGAHVFTVPYYKDRSTFVRAVPSPDGIEYLAPADYHRNPVDPNGSLVVREWGTDLAAYVKDHSDLDTEVHALRDRTLGLDGPMLEVFVCRKH